MRRPDDLTEPLVVSGREALAKALRKTCMTAYEDGKGGHRSRRATGEEQADALLASGVVTTGAEYVAALADDEALVGQLIRRMPLGAAPRVRVLGVLNALVTALSEREAQR